jgi:hypothetical protein
MNEQFSAADLCESLHSYEANMHLKLADFIEDTLIPIESEICYEQHLYGHSEKERDFYFLLKAGRQKAYEFFCKIGGARASLRLLAHMKEKESRSSEDAIAAIHSWRREFGASVFDLFVEIREDLSWRYYLWKPPPAQHIAWGLRAALSEFADSVTAGVDGEGSGTLE